MSHDPDTAVTITEMLYPRLTAPDLGEAEDFLNAFGMVTSERTATKLYMRGTGSTPHLYVAEKAEQPRYLGVALGVADEDALARLARRPGASTVHELDEPGGGKRVTLTDPNGYTVEVVCGQEPLAPIDVPELRTNTAADRTRRVGRGPWGVDQPPHIMRFGHVVMKSPRFDEMLEFYESFGLLRSDVGVTDDGTLEGVFLRIDAGHQYVDHHAIQLANIPQTGYHHVSYEVHHWSEVFEGAAHFAKLGKYRQWGKPARHYVGGQVGVYFSDPWGRLHEFWSDSDQINSDHVPEEWTMERIITTGPMWDEPDLEFFLEVAE